VTPHSLVDCRDCLQKKIRYKNARRDRRKGRIKEKERMGEGRDRIGIEKNSMASVRKRTIPTERPPLVSEVRTNVLWVYGAT
jgi:hypothetical protein